MVIKVGIYLPKNKSNKYYLAVDSFKSLLWQKQLLKNQRGQGKNH